MIIRVGLGLVSTAEFNLPNFWISFIKYKTICGKDFLELSKP